MGLSAITAKIRSRGFWDVAIRPEPFEKRRVDYGDLDEILKRAVVRLRGWPVPFIDHRVPVLHGVDWIGQDIDAATVAQYEAWRFFTSGQFAHVHSVSADWREGREATAVPNEFDSVIEVWEILFYITELFELAARLALGGAGGERITLDVLLSGLQQRALVIGFPRRSPFMTPHQATSESLQFVATYAKDELVAEPKQKALEMARDFFLRFGWKPSVEQLAEMQSELISRR